MTASPRRMFASTPTLEELRSYMGPFAEHLGYKFNTDTEFVDEVLTGEIAIFEETGDVYCPCRMRVGDPKEDAKIVCPCIPFHADEFAAMRKCWCGLFILADVEDGSELLGVIDEPEAGSSVDVPICGSADLPVGTARHVKVGKSDIAVVRTEAGVFALSNVCRHAFGPLADGFVDGHTLVCPWHGWRYDVRDGRTDHPNADVRTYPTSERNGYVFVTIVVRNSSNA